MVGVVVLLQPQGQAVEAALHVALLALEPFKLAVVVLPLALVVAVPDAITRRPGAARSAELVSIGLLQATLVRAGALRCPG